MRVPGAACVPRAAEESHFASIEEVRERLADSGYLADEGIAGVVYLADRLAKPVLVEGPAGTGKTELAKSVARVTDSRLIRLQCYEGLDESKALYEWNYKKQLLRIQAQQVVEGSDRRAALTVTLARRDGMEGARRGHLLRGVPPHETAARGDPLRGSGRAAR